PPGGFFWCNGTLQKQRNISTNSFCLPISLFPQLTIYSEGELRALAEPVSQKIKRAIFLPLVMGISLASPLVAAGLGTGALIHSIDTTQDFSNKLQLAIEASAESLASLQRQITSIAQVTLQNRRTLDHLLTANKGGTCLFLHEECCYYVNKTGIVETNIQSPRKVRESLKAKHLFSDPPLNWWQSPVLTWMVPLLTPVIILCF
ncbi:EFC1 protein, partial [Crocuta crocuta]